MLEHPPDLPVAAVPSDARQERSTSEASENTQPLFEGRGWVDADPDAGSRAAVATSNGLHRRYARPCIQVLPAPRLCCVFPTVIGRPRIQRLVPEEANVCAGYLDSS